MYCFQAKVTLLFYVTIINHLPIPLLLKSLFNAWLTLSLIVCVNYMYVVYCKYHICSVAVLGCHSQRLESSVKKD